MDEKEDDKGDDKERERTDKVVELAGKWHSMAPTLTDMALR